MKVSAVLLRWYKSFNLSYVGYPDRNASVLSRPWNQLSRDTDSEDDYPFIEIPLTDDITTIVGANESGKSHLLSAISKVLTGKGIPDGFGSGSDFSRTDLCHYTSPRSKTASDWPNVGLQFSQLSQSEMKAIGDAAGNEKLSKIKPTPDTRLTLVIAPNPQQKVWAHLFLADDHVKLDKSQLEEVRKCLPRVEFIRSEIAFSDQIPIKSLLAAYDGNSGTGEQFDFIAAQRAAALLASLSLQKGQGVDAAAAAKLLAEKESLQSARIDPGNCELELLLFEKVLGIPAETISFMGELTISDRTHADGLVERWNREIEERLNLSHYWTQDDSFALRLNYKQGMIYFEITDKTGATYSFRERSSGLRYFLSYYIQAKALEATSGEGNVIVLMDEPDSFLSIIGQKNLLAVFESLVKPESSGQRCQLVYTSHSPFLINRNFPRRLRLVRKGDAEEGTQLSDQAMLRRYEPVRSALGIDCAQTLFMGATNVLVEGPTDQYTLCELIRHFARPDNIGELLDLNSVVMVSAESAPSVEKVLSASQWGDEAVPATIVLLDSDEAGDTVERRITGKARKAKKLIDESFVLRIGDLLKLDRKVVTTEDILPTTLMRKAISKYLEHWWPDVDSKVIEAIEKESEEASFTDEGVVEGINALFQKHLFKTKRSYDKYGVLEEAVRLLSSGKVSEEEEEELKSNVFQLCEQIRRAISASQQAARRETGKQAVRRLVDDFFVQFKQECGVFDLILLLERIQRDLELLGEDGEQLDNTIRKLIAELRRARSADQQRLSGVLWNAWAKVLREIRNNPLMVEVQIIEGIPSLKQMDGVTPVEQGVGNDEHDLASQETQPDKESKKTETGV